MRVGSWARRQAGSTFIGFIAGLICGLAIAVVVALFITKAPIPFVDKAGSVKPETAPSAGAALPDPNKPFNPKDVAPPPAAPADAAADGDKKFSFYDVAPSKPADKPADKPAAKPAETKPADAKPADAKPAAAADDKTKYLLQAGAFKAQADAEAMKAKLALLGFNAAVSSADKDGAPVYRVRIGPIDKLDEANRTRQTLVQSGVDASVITVK